MVLIPIFLAFTVLLAWVLVVLPQRRQLAAHRAFTATLEVGEEVMTTSGLFGTIAALDDEIVHLDAGGGVVVRFARGAIARKVTEPEPGFDHEESDADLFTGELSDADTDTDTDTKADADAGEGGG